MFGLGKITQKDIVKYLRIQNILKIKCKCCINSNPNQANKNERTTCFDKCGKCCRYSRRCSYSLKQIVHSCLFACSRSGYILKIHTKAFAYNYPSTIFRFEACASDVLLKSERHPPRGLSAFKRSAVEAILREMHCR